MNLANTIRAQAAFNATRTNIYCNATPLLNTDIKHETSVSYFIDAVHILSFYNRKGSERLAVNHQTKTNKDIYFSLLKNLRNLIQL